MSFEEVNEEIEQLKLKYRRERLRHHSYEEEKHFFDLFKKGDPAALSLLDEFDDYPHVDIGAGDEVRSYKNRMIIAVAFMTRAMAEVGVDHEDLFIESDGWIDKIERTNNLDELKSLEKFFFKRCLLLVQNHLTGKYGEIVQNCIRLINQHLSEPMPLTWLADQVNVHPNYLSTLFKKEVGQTVTEYITMTRIEEGRRMLRYSNDSVAMIANILGFSQPSYFSYQFKKHTGQTPKEYRTNMT
ncbi:AraC family transcriptional regulator [Halalkalibacillus sediminis]|uniref:AraC family transcriptional regulator n=1 Tax=Halalkalibacillus sediminis TaxID=2018042 RepID=UPI00139031FA|nr:AraC family transcriptional regulator [Halalkalibacillus sediminis]